MQGWLCQPRNVFRVALLFSFQGTQARDFVATHSTSLAVQARDFVATHSTSLAVQARDLVLPSVASQRNCVSRTQLTHNITGVRCRQDLFEKNFDSDPASYIIENRKAEKEGFEPSRRVNDLHP